MSYKLLISTFIVIILAGFASGLYIGLTYTDGGTGDGSPILPSVEYVQRELNKVINPALFEPLVVDGVAGTKTIQAWQFYSTEWEAENEKKMCEK